MNPQLLQQLSAFRKNLHQYPELSFQQFQTHRKVKSLLLEFGVPPKDIHQFRRGDQLPTGLIADIHGEGKPQGKSFCLALRADMDALPMMELNDNLPYASKNHGVAHACGHDGHTACLLGVVPLLLARKQEIPSNKTVRLIFQPSEEMINGARFMIDNGCLEGVDEVYGMHNAIMGQFGHLYCKEGVVLSDSTTIKIVIVGDGGHGSLSGGLKISIWKAVEFYSNIKSYIDELKIQGRFFECVLPVFQAGEAANVISEKAVIEGTLRTFESQTKTLVLDRINHQIEKIREEGFQVSLQTKNTSAVINSKAETENVLRVAKKLLGEQKAGPDLLPIPPSEDFSEYTKVRPGAFFFLSIKATENQPINHNPKFDFNDGIIQTACNIWLNLALDRALST